MATRILVVDDEQDMVDLLTYSLKERGYEVVSARNGLEAVHKARSFQPDCVLLDLMLDGMDGFTVCEILRHQPSTVNLPVIMVTALVGEMPRLNGFDSGADDFITKPFNVEALMQRMEKVLEKRRRRCLEVEEARDWAGRKVVSKAA